MPFLVKHLGLADYVATYEAMRTFTKQRDANTLDEYQEGTFIPTVSYLFNGAPLNLLAAGTGILSANEPTISGKYGIYTKIGKLIQFTIKFSIENWYISATSALVAQAPLNAFTAYGEVFKQYTIFKG